MITPTGNVGDPGGCVQLFVVAVTNEELIFVNVVFPAGAK